MHTKKLLFVANWKTALSFSQALSFCKDNYKALVVLGNKASLVICPSFLALSCVIKLLAQTGIRVGAQHCSSYEKGPYTGEVAAASLAEIGCSYCIVGHSERRHYFKETNNDIAQKVIQLLSHGIQPIICVGETRQEYEQKQTYEIIIKQLQPICSAISQLSSNKPTSLVIAYEPVWAIGTGILPQKDYLKQVFLWLTRYVNKHIPHTNTISLYGGSINKDSIKPLLTISSINGFLIGKASTSFKNLQKIVSLDV